MINHKSRVEWGILGAKSRWSKQPPFKERFWNRVDIRSDSECWPWKKSRMKSGYGKVKRSGKHLLSHRIAFELSNGRPPKKGLCVLHHCDNPPCCNPKHLYEGTYQDNMQDALKRNRLPRFHKRLKPQWLVSHNISVGIRNAQRRAMQLGIPLRKYAANITEDIISQIHQLKSTKTQMEIAEIFGLSQGTVSRVINRKRRFAIIQIPSMA